MLIYVSLLLFPLKARLFQRPPKESATAAVRPELDSIMRHPTSLLVRFIQATIIAASFHFLTL